jgi:TrmH family RNA methyltransferase
MKLSKSQEKIILSLHTKKGRKKHGKCLVEGKKILDTAGDAVEYFFNKNEIDNFDRLVTTQTAQDVAGVAKIPKWTIDNVKKNKIIIVLDGVQDPGNVGTILRLCLGFDASLVLIESADPTSPKVVRSSVGAMFNVPWIEINRADALNLIKSINRKVYKLEKRDGAIEIQKIDFDKNIIIIAGSEGFGISIPIRCESMYIKHSNKLESLNVASALSIALYNIKQ